MNRNRWLLVLIGLIGGVLISGRIALPGRDGSGTVLTTAEALRKA